MRLINKIFSLVRSTKIKPYDSEISNNSINSDCRTLTIVPMMCINSSNSNYVSTCVICNNDLRIIEASDNFFLITNYTKEDLIGEFIGILMNDLLSYLHRNIFIQKFQKANIFEQKKLLSKLYGHNKRREVIIYDKFRNPHYVDMSINMNVYNNLIIDLNHNMSNNNNINLYTSDIKLDRHIFIKSKNNIIIINIDFIDSTQITKENGVEHMIAINKLFYYDIVNLIINDYYPFIYIHEIIGDSFILVMNIDWGYTINEYCASIAIKFLVELNRLTCKYIKFKVGITYGNLYYGYLDHNIRFFGDEMNMSSRLHSMCKNGEIIVQNNFFDKLKSEIDVSNLSFTKEIYNLKGLGMTECVKIIMNDKSIKFIK
jgi:hypothetical protein